MWENDKISEFYMQSGNVKRLTASAIDYSVCYMTACIIYKRNNSFFRIQSGRHASREAGGRCRYSNLDLCIWVTFVGRYCCLYKLGVVCVLCYV